MVNSGCSLGNGSDRKPAFSAVPPLAGRPPVQAGIDPSALPAISAPTGVSVVPSLDASSGDTAAITPLANSESVRAPVCSRLFVVFIVIVVLKNLVRLEVHAKAERNEVAVSRSVVFTVKEVGVSETCGVGVLVVSIQTQAYSLGTFSEQTIRAIAIDIMRPGNAWLQVYTGEDIRVIPNGASAVAPRGRSYETVIFAIAAYVFTGVAIENLGARFTKHTRGNLRRRQRTRTEYRVTTIANLISAFQATDMSNANLTHQR